MKKTVLYLLALVLCISCNHLQSKDLSSANGDTPITDVPKITANEERSQSNVPDNHLFVQTKNLTSSWTPEEKSTFMTACVEGTTENMGESKSTQYCACLLEKLERLYPIADDVIQLPEKKQKELSKDCEQ